MKVLIPLLLLIVGIILLSKGIMLFLKQSETKEKTVLPNQPTILTLEKEGKYDVYLIRSCRRPFQTSLSVFNTINLQLFSEDKTAIVFHKGSPLTLNQGKRYEWQWLYKNGLFFQ